MSDQSLGGPLDLIVHRGTNGSAPENSLDGIAEARALSPDLWIEIDIGATADGVPVLCHDLSLDRLFGRTALLSDTPLADLPGLPALAQVLDAFPGQRFLLDTRDDAHDALFPDSPLGPADLRADPADALLEALAPVLAAAPPGRLRLMTGTRAFRDAARAAWPHIPADLAERAWRDDLATVAETGDTAPLGPGAERAYVRVSAVQPRLVAGLKAAGLAVYATASFPHRSLENSLWVLDRARAAGADGATVCPLNAALLEKFGP